MIEENKILEIRQKADIVDVISDYVDVTQKGKNHVCVCPFHNDTNPSMVISREKQIFNCFSCGSGGNVFKFVMMYENINFPEAIKVIADKVSIDVNVSNIKSNDKWRDDYELMKLSMKYYFNNINTENGLKAKHYLNKRGISEEVINYFNIGLSSNEKNELTNFLSSQGKALDDFVKLGLSNKNGIDIYDTFRNRIMIPITNAKNDVVGFTGRIYNDEDFAKYVNTKETHIFKKGHILFNYYNAKETVRNEKKIVVVEGNMDAIKMVAHNIKNVVATMGTALTVEQIDLLKKLKCNIVLMMDSDNAGELATIKNGDFLLEHGLHCDVVRLSGAKDPDEYLEKNGREALITNINNPINFIDYKIRYLRSDKNLNSPEELANFVKDILSTLKNVDSLTRNIVIDKISKDYNIDKSIMLGEVEFIKPATVPDWYEEPRVVEVPKIKMTKYSKLANAIFYYIASDYKYLRIYKSDLNFFKEKEERLLASEIETFYSNNKEASLADFLTNINEKGEMAEKMNYIIREFANEDLSHEKFIEYLNMMKQKLNDDEIKEVLSQVKNEIDMDKKLKLMERLTKLKKGSVDYERN